MRGTPFTPKIVVGYSVLALVPGLLVGGLAFLVSWMLYQDETGFVLVSVLKGIVIGYIACVSLYLIRRITC